MKKINSIYPLFILGVLLLLATRCKKDNVTPAVPDTVTDIDGNVYHTVKIGTQVWMIENLRVTKYNDGIAIPLITDLWSAATTEGAYCWYNNDESTYKNAYGALYHWYSVNSGKLCHKGWHVPTDVEWTTLTTYLGGESVAGNKLKETGTAHWLSPNDGATNESGFTGLPGGIRGGTFSDVGNFGLWWSSTERITDKGWYRLLWHGSGSVGRDSNDDVGLSVRCIMN